MDLRELIVELARILAWPLAFIAFLFLFKNQIMKLLENISLRRFRGRFGNVEIEADFEERTVRVERLAQELGIDQSDLDEEAQDDFEAIRLLVDLSPSAAVIEGWRVVEVEVRRIARALGIRGAGRIPAVEAIQLLIHEGIIEAALGPLLNDLRLLRNTAIHDREAIHISESSAHAYINAAMGIVSALKLLPR